MSFQKMKKITFIIGGVRSGKSELAIKIAKKTGKKTAFLATAQAGDEEMRSRIEKHRKMRPKNWITVEVDKSLKDSLDKINQDVEVVILDCLTFYLSSILSKYESLEKYDFFQKEQEIISFLKKEVKVLFSFWGQLIIVSNEVGQGIVPPYPMGRLFRDIQGEANKIIAEEADEVYLMTAGVPISIKQ